MGDWSGVLPPVDGTDAPATARVIPPARPPNTTLALAVAGPTTVEAVPVSATKEGELPPVIHWTTSKVKELLSLLVSGDHVPFHSGGLDDDTAAVKTFKGFNNYRWTHEHVKYGMLWKHWCVVNPEMGRGMDESHPMIAFKLQKKKFNSVMTVVGEAIQTKVCAARQRTLPCFLAFVPDSWFDSPLLSLLLLSFRLRAARMGEGVDEKVVRARLRHRLH